MGLIDEFEDLSKPDYEWLAESVQPPPSPPASDIKIRLDGFFRLTYSDAYTAAWQALLPRAKELAIPILYLQRHALELRIKDLIRSCLAIRDEMHLGHEVFGLPEPSALQTEARVTTGHKFEKLFNCLVRNLEILNLPPLPEEYQRARELLEVVEDGDETRLRYDTSMGSWRPSFDYDTDQPKVADIGEISNLLTAIGTVRERLGPDPRDEPVSFIDHVAHAGFIVNDGIGFELQRLEKRTRKNEVTWRLEPRPAIHDGHPDFSGALDLIHPAALC